MLLMTRIVSVAMSGLATVYLIYHLNKGHRPLYFRCVFYAILAQFLTSIYYLAISTDPSWNHIFSVGVFGELAPLLFLGTANLRFIPREYDEFHKVFSPAGVIGLVCIVALYGTTSIFNYSFAYILCNVLYAAGLGFYAYTVLDIARNKYNNPFKSAVKTFNILYLCYLTASSLLQLAIAMYNIPFILITLIVLALATAVSLSVGIVSLKKGLDPWTI